ncbi:MAG: 2'-5' RNA ligase family protein [Eubacteriales bacterium]|nr:2'-5' RNA ligase family protein [Eubacteriales bacterium]
MAEKLLYVLAGYDAPTEQKLQAWQNRLYAEGFVGTHTKNIPQHITLGSFPTQAEERLCALLQETAAQIKAFPVTFNHIGVFGGGKVLFVAPDVNHALLDLKERFGESHGWTAHSTLLIDEPEAVLRAAQSVLSDFGAFEGTVTQLYLYEFFPARHIATVQLQK